MQTITKTYPEIPFGHRQHKHEGHCSFCHGHNWTLKFTFAARTMDENGFIIDFGKLKFLKQWITSTLDHAHLFNRDDKEAWRMVEAFPGLFHPLAVPDASAEGIARMLLDVANGLLQGNVPDCLERGLRCIRVEVEEDSRNTTLFAYDPVEETERFFGKPLSELATYPETDTPGHPDNPVIPTEPPS